MEPDTKDWLEAYAMFTEVGGELTDNECVAFKEVIKEDLRDTIEAVEEMYELEREDTLRN